MAVRFSVIIGIFLAAYSFLLFHLYELQIAHGEYYLAKAESRYALSGLLEPRRGTVYFTDKNGERIVAAATKDFPIVYAVPKVLQDPETVSEILAPLLLKDKDALLEKLSKSGESYRFLGAKVGADVVRKIESLKIKGLFTDAAPYRFYPFGPLAAHLLGFVSPDSEGKGVSGRYGIEGFYDGELRGAQGEVRDAKFVPPTPGKELVLTIDPHIQREAERILEGLATSYKAKGGGVIVQDPKTGKILAMAGRTAFDPNNYSLADLSDLLNPMVQEIYEPGSVAKILTMAAGIDAGKVTPETTYVDKGVITVSGRKIRNSDFEQKGAYGRMTMTNVIEHSLNTGAVFVMRELGREAFIKYLRDFGLGEKTNVDLEGEVRGDLRALHPKAPEVAFATASYGQGVAVTPLALINAVSVIANGGKLMRPYVNAALAPQEVRTVIRKESAGVVARMMISAIDKAGVAKVNGYALAGKTGTAFVPDFEKGGYTDKVVNTYVGFGPASDPKFTILIKLDEPEGAPFAALTVVPAFRDLAEFLFNYYKISPDRL